MTGSFTSGKRTNVVQETEQIKTTLIGVLASSQDRSQQAIDTLSQHAAAPGTAEDGPQGFPSDPELIRAKGLESLIEARVPLAEIGLLLPQRQGMALGFGFKLPQAGQGFKGRCTPLVKQGGQGLPQQRLVSKQSLSQIYQIAAQLLVDTTTPSLQLLTGLAQAVSSNAGIAHLSAGQVNQAKLSVHLVGDLIKGIKPVIFPPSAQAFPHRQMLGQSFDVVAWLNKRFVLTACKAA
jgi:hypothetical protein